MLIRTADLTRIVAGEVTTVFRRWRRPTVKAGGTLRTASGLLAIHAVDVVDEHAITRAEARAAGYTDADALCADLAAHASSDAMLYRIRLGPSNAADPREELRRRSDLSPRDVTTLAARLARFDAHSPHGPWASTTLQAIAARPATRAGDLAATLGFDRLWFKTQVRKLKALGLTESLEVGYRLSPRGKALLAYLGAPALPKATTAAKAGAPPQRLGRAISRARETPIARRGSGGSRAR